MLFKNCGFLVLKTHVKATIGLRTIFVEPHPT